MSGASSFGLGLHVYYWNDLVPKSRPVLGDTFITRSALTASIYSMTLGKDFTEVLHCYLKGATALFG